MVLAHRVFAACCVFAAVASAQGRVPPFRLGPTNPVAGLSSAALGVAQVSHASFVHLAGDPPGVFYATLTVFGLSPAMGGVGWADLVCGRYDVAADVFTPNNDAAALNTAVHDHSMTVHRSGLLAVFDRHNSFPFLAARTAIGQPWQAVGPIGNVPPGQTGFNPALVEHRGQTHLVFNFLSGIAMQPIDLVAAHLTGTLYQPTMIVGSGGGHAFGGSPITTPGGEILGLSYTELMSSYSDHRVALDLDPATPGALLIAPPWNMHYTGCAFVGGRFLDAQYPGSLMFAIDTIWCTGGRAPVGGVMDVRMMTPPTNGPEVYVSVLGGGSAFAPQGIAVPGLQGLLGLIPMGWFSNLVTHDNRNGEALLRLNVPNVPGLSGLSMPVQAVTWEFTSGAAFLGNSARLSID